jgi:hypothetical protein
VTEIFKVSTPSPPTVESPDLIVVPVAAFPTNTPWKTSLPDVPAKVSVLVVKVNVFPSETDGTPLVTIDATLLATPAVV